MWQQMSHINNFLLLMLAISVFSIHHLMMMIILTQYQTKLIHLNTLGIILTYGEMLGTKMVIYPIIFYFEFWIWFLMLRVLWGLIVTCLDISILMKFINRIKVVLL